MGPPPDPESMVSMLENPQFQSTMNEALQNPAMIDMMIQQNPMLRDMGPGVRQMMQSPEFRRMLTDPNSLRQAMQMQRAMGGLGGGAGGGAGAFPAPGVTNTTPEENRAAQGGTQNAGIPPVNPFMPGAFGASNPFAALFGGNAPNLGANPTPGTTGGGQTDAGQRSPEAAAAGEGQNPLGSLLNSGLFGGAQGQGGGINPFNPQQNPFLRDPELMNRVAQAMGGGQPGAGGGGAANPLAALLGGGQPGEGGGAVNPLAALLGGGGLDSLAPQDNRPPEERYAVQLGQLNDMGFFDFDRNIQALRRAGGSVQGAVEYLLSLP